MMKVYYFRIGVERVSLALPDLLKSVMAKDQRDREIPISDKDVFLEHFAEQNGLYEMGFTQRRWYNGPGLSSRGQLTKDFSITDDDGFGEETAAVLAPNGLFAVQYNHFGARPGSIRAYLQTCLKRALGSAGPGDAAITMVPVINEAARAKIERGDRSMVRMEVAILTNRIDERMARNNIALETALDMRNRTDADKIELALSVRARRKDRPSKLENLWKPIQGMLQHSDSLAKLKVRVRDKDGSPPELLDLLEEREVSVVTSGLVLSGGRRYTHESRVSSIRQELEDRLHG